MRFFGSRFGGLYVFGLVFLAISLVLRVALAVRAGPEVGLGLPVLAQVIFVGLLFDLVAYFYFVSPAALFLVLAPDRVLRWRINRYVSLFLYGAAIAVLLFNDVAEWLFWDEFESRYNFVAVDYLVYTQELVGNAFESYPVVPVLVGIGVVAVAIVLLTRKWFMASFESTSSLVGRLKVGAVYLAVPLLSLLAVDQSMFRISENHYTNELAKNGLYTFFAALWHNEIDYEDFYVTEDDEAAFSRARELVAPGERFTDDGPLGITRDVVHPGEEKRSNVIILVVESLSAEFVGALGSKDGLTPNLDRLADEGLLFRNFYATGTRTDRGLEAITLSIPPTPGRSLVKRPDNANLFSIGQIFGRRGYDAKFIYSGYSTFDNMQTFFEDNGFRTVDGADFPKDEITFSNAWGVCDQDLYRRAVKECDESSAAGRPFCFILLTTSNHRPFTFPPQVKVPPGRGRFQGVWYTDYAIGEFVAAARARPWFDNTLLVIVADHCASSAGKAEVPVAKYHIPLLIYAPKLVKPGRVDSVASQIDIAPTVLGLLNFSYRSKFFGADLLRQDPARALVGNYEKIGLYRDGKLALLWPRRKSQVYEVSPDGRQRQAPMDNRLLADTMAYYQSAAYLVRHGLYRPE